MCITQWIRIPFIKTNLAPCCQIRDVNRGQARAITKSPSSDTRHGARYGDGGQARAARVFVYCFISAFYELKGRKVKT